MTKDNEASVPAKREYFGPCPQCGVLLGFGHEPDECKGPANRYQSCSDCEAQQCWGPGKCRCTCHNKPATAVAQEKLKEFETAIDSDLEQGGHWLRENEDLIRAALRPATVAREPFCKCECHEDGEPWCAECFDDNHVNKASVEPAAQTQPLKWPTCPSNCGSGEPTFIPFVYGIPCNDKWHKRPEPAVEERVDAAPAVVSDDEVPFSPTVECGNCHKLIGTKVYETLPQKITVFHFCKAAPAVAGRTQGEEAAPEYVDSHFSFSEGCTLIRRESLISCLDDFVKGVQNGRYK